MLAQGVLKHIVYQSFKILQEKKIQTSVHNPANHVNKKKTLHIKPKENTIAQFNAFMPTLL